MIKLNLSVEQINVVLGSLGNLPFAQVADLIIEIQNQAKVQIDNDQDTKE